MMTTRLSKGYDYSSGVWQFEGHAYVPGGTTGVCIMQVYGANRTNTATALMLRVYDGALMYHTKWLIEDDIFGRWFRVNVIHEVNWYRADQGFHRWRSEAGCTGPWRALALLQVWRSCTKLRLLLHGIPVEGYQGIKVT